ncbi:hypothetical protein [Nocardia sp. CNY236]|uniref:hypothetical protein n=1 Tax=Nocardia sp. CNY236 TaxID=1169152 RepID=UPI0004031097|nr:hypothetical protein [Nocardia sp. CNY236]
METGETVPGPILPNTRDLVAAIQGHVPAQHPARGILRSIRLLASVSPEPLGAGTIAPEYGRNERVESALDSIEDRLFGDLYALIERAVGGPDITSAMVDLVDRWIWFQRHRSDSWIGAARALAEARIAYTAQRRASRGHTWSARVSSIPTPTAAELQAMFDTPPR